VHYLAGANPATVLLSTGVVDRKVARPLLQAHAALLLERMATEPGAHVRWLRAAARKARSVWQLLPAPVRSGLHALLRRAAQRHHQPHVNKGLLDRAVARVWALAPEGLKQAARRLIYGR
jgi:hypothetical protein